MYERIGTKKVIKTKKQKFFFSFKFGFFSEKKTKYSNLFFFISEKRTKFEFFFLQKFIGEKKPNSNLFFFSQKKNQISDLVFFPEKKNQIWRRKKNQKKN